MAKLMLKSKAIKILIDLKNKNKLTKSDENLKEKTLQAINTLRAPFRSKDK